jgi:hypothetical protein
VAARDRLVHPLDHDRGDQMLLGGEVAEQRGPADSGPLRDLADAHLEPALAEHLRGGIQQPPPVAPRIGAQRSRVRFHVIHILLSGR